MKTYLTFVLLLGSIDPAYAGALQVSASQGSLFKTVLSDPQSLVSTIKKSPSLLYSSK